MNRVILGRLVWKEFRQYRTLLLLAALVGVLAVGAVAIVSASTNRPRSPEVLMQIALAIPILYAIGCAPTTFAAERESGTIDFLRFLPQPPRAVAVAKIGYAFLSTAALAVALGIVCFLASQEELSRSFGWEQWPAMSIAVLEVVAWGLFFSLWMRQPLWAVVAAAFASLLFGFGVTSLMADSLRSPGTQRWDGAETAAVRLAIVGVLTSVDLAWGMRWLRGGEAASAFGGVTSKKSSATEVSPIDRRWTGVGRLLWQTWRQSRGLALLMAAGYVGVLACLWVIENTHHQSRLLTEAAWFLWPAFAALAGSVAFFLDQQGRQYRFFAELGVSPRSLWCARQIFWGGYAALVGAVALGAFTWSALRADSFSNGTEAPWNALAYGASVSAWTIASIFLTATLGAVAYATGQLASLFFRSGVIGFFLGLVGAGVASLWIGLLDQLMVPRVVSALPWLLGAWWASWSRVSAWLADRDDRAGWTRPCAIVFAALVGTLGAAMTYRVVEIPRAPQREYVSAEIASALAAKSFEADAQRTGEAYRAAAESERNPSSGSSADGELAPSVRLFLTATRGSSCSLSCDSAQETKRLIERLANLARKLFAEARAAESAGNVEAARDYYLAALRFARHLYESGAWEGLTAADEIEDEAVERLVAWAAGQAEPAEVARLRKDVAWSREAMWSSEERALIAGRRNFESVLVGARPVDDSPDQASMLVLSWMPWERWRWQRIADYDLALQWQYIHSMTHAATANGLTDWNWRMAIEQNIVQEWTTRSVPVPYGNRAMAWAQRLVRQRGLEVRLALREYKLAHGEWPESLLELGETGGATVAETGMGSELFVFVAKGSSAGLQGRTLRDKPCPLPAGTPFLWWQSLELRDYGGVPLDPETADAGGYLRIAPVAPGHSPAIGHRNALWQAGVILPLE